MRRLVRATVTALLLVLSTTPAPAKAHAELVEAMPEPNGALVDAPSELRITFSEPIDDATAAIRVVDAEQLTVEDVGPMELVDGATTAILDLPELEPGVYTVAYQVVSTVDGHATAGSYAFLIDPSGAAPPPTDTSTFSSPSVDPFTVGARWIALAMLLVAFGSLVMWWNAGRDSPPPWGLVGLGALLGAIGVVGYLALSARPISTLPATDTGLRLPFDIAGGYGWTPFAVAMRVAALGGLLTAALSLVAARGWIAQPWAARVGLVLVAAALAGMSFAGHAASIGGPLFAALDWLHLVAAGAWLGGLPAAFVLGRRRGDDGAPSLGGLLRRHGRIGLVAGPVVVATGIANSPIVLGSGRDLVASDYGNLVVAKAVLVGVALGIGAVNHLALRGRGRAAVSGLVGAELVVAAVAVAVAATMVTIQPAAERRAELATADVNPAHFFGEAGGVRVHLAVSVPAPGDQAYRVILTDPATGGPPDEVQKVFLGFTPPPGAAAEPMRVELMPEAGALSGLYVANGPFTPLVGDWELAVIVRRAGERDAAVGFEMVVTAPGTPELGPPPDTGIGVPAPIAAAWSLLPDGPLAWLPAVVVAGVVLLLGRLRRSTWRAVGRGAATTILVAAVIVAGSRSLVDAANAPSADELRAQPATTEADPALGEPLYLANCASCHGVELDGDGPVDTLPRAGALAEAVRTASDAELSYRIAYGIAGTPMPAFAGLLTPDERADLIAYLRQAADTE